MAENLDSLKSIYTIEHAWNDEGCAGSPRNSCKSPFRQDSKPSFSVYDDFRHWKDHATGESGDVFSFIQNCRNCGFREALEIVKSRNFLGHSRIPHKKHCNPIRKPRLNSSNLQTIPEEIMKRWEEGIQFLCRNPKTCIEIDEWRKWPSGTSLALAESGFIGLPKFQESRRLAFPVQKISESSVSEIGIHLRHGVGKCGWIFLPNAKMHSQKTPPLPFVMGAGNLRNAEFIAITEGQWDAISFAAWIGWLEHDASWPDDICVIGIRGANNWRIALDHLQWRRETSVALIPDNDAAGLAWKKEFLSSLRERARKVSVFVPESGDLSDQLAVNPQKRDSLCGIIERSVA